MMPINRLSCVINVATALSLFWMSCPAVMALNDSPDTAIRLGQKFEAQGNYPAAIQQYLNVAMEHGSSHSCYGSISTELARLLQRRALALRICLIKKGGRVSPKEVNLSYVALKELEPDNPTWPYLQALLMLKVLGNPDNVFPLFHQAINTTGGQESVRQKAIADLAKYKPEVNSEISQENAQVKKQDWDWDHGGEQRYWKGLHAAAVARSQYRAPENNGQNKPSGNGDWSASQNAQQAGDWGASSRLSGGNSTWDDRNSYSHY